MIHDYNSPLRKTRGRFDTETTERHPTMLDNDDHKRPENAFATRDRVTTCVSRGSNGRRPSSLGRQPDSHVTVRTGLKPPASNRRKRRERRNTRTRENLWRSDPHFRTTGSHSALWLHKSVRSRSTIFLFVPFVALCDVIYQFKVHAMDLFPSVVAFPRTCTIPPRSMIAHAVATGSLSLHFRAKLER